LKILVVAFDNHKLKEWLSKMIGGSRIS